MPRDVITDQRGEAIRADAETVDQWAQITPADVEAAQVRVRSVNTDLAELLDAQPDDLEGNDGA